MRTYFGKKSIVVVGIFLITAIFFMNPSMVKAQDVATGSATATVLTMLTVTATQALAFGDVMQGVKKVVGNNVDLAAGVASGIFSIAGAANKEISAYMQLPDYLWNSTNEDRLVIAFSSTDAVVDTLPGTPGTPGLGNSGDVDPHNMPEFELSGAAGTAAIYLGGTVWPTVDQRNDAYSADIILTVAYTGN